MLLKKKDRKWQDLIKKCYVKKEIAINLNDQLNENENVIQDLKNLLNEKEDLEFQNGYLSRKNNRLMAENKGKRNYIENFLDDAGRWEHEILNHDRFFSMLKNQSFTRINRYNNYMLII